MIARERINCYIAMILCIIAFIGGELLLNRVAPMENPPFGRTLYIILGCTWMLASVIVFVTMVRNLIQLHKKERHRKKYPIKFLDKRDSKKAGHA